VLNDVGDVSIRFLDKFIEYTVVWAVLNNLSKLGELCTDLGDKLTVLNITLRIPSILNEGKI
jgi:hypothetical protein